MLVRATLSVRVRLLSYPCHSWIDLNMKCVVVVLVMMSEFVYVLISGCECGIEATAA